jgi:hypothetical protein
MVAMVSGKSVHAGPRFYGGAYVYPYYYGFDPTLLVEPALSSLDLPVLLLTNLQRALECRYLF